MSFVIRPLFAVAALALATPVFAAEVAVPAATASAVTTEAKSDVKTPTATTTETKTEVKTPAASATTVTTDTKVKADGSAMSKTPAVKEKSSSVETTKKVSKVSHRHVKSAKPS